MRTREKSYEDYGITKKEKFYILEFCRNANDEEKAIIKNALSEINPYIAPFVYYSLVDNISYDKMIVKQEIYMDKGDFYAYRRLGMSAIKRWMILSGIWKIE